MVEGEIPREFVQGKPSRVRRVVPGAWGAFRAAQKDDADRVAARIAVRVGVDVEELREPDVEAGLLPDFPPGCMFDGLAVVDEAAGQSPAFGRVFPPNENDATVEFHDHVHGWYGIPERHGGTRRLAPRGVETKLDTPAGSL